MKRQNKEFVTHYYYSNMRATQPGQQRPKAQHIGRRITFIVGLIVASLIIWGLINGHDKKGDDAAAKSTPKVAAAKTSTPIPAKPTITSEQMAEAINQVIAANSDVDISVSVIDLKTGSLTHYGVSSTVVFEAASVAKLITATDYLHQVETNETSLDRILGGTNAQENIRLMIENSDNTAWHNLNDFLTHDSLLSYATSIGITDYDPDANTLNSDSIAILEKQLYQGKLLNPTHTQLLLSYMAQANRTDLIKAAVPANVNLYHKAGWLEDRDHDAAIIDDGSHPYVLAIFTNGHNLAHNTDRSVLIQQITKATTQHFIDKSL